MHRHYRWCATRNPINGGCTGIMRRIPIKSDQASIEIVLQRFKTAKSGHQVSTTNYKKARQQLPRELQGEAPPGAAANCKARGAMLSTIRLDKI
jgi:hypothetical protein